MRRLSSWAAVLTAATTVACSHAPIQTGATPSTAKTSATANATGYYILGVQVEPAVNTPVSADTPGYYLFDVRAAPPR